MERIHGFGKIFKNLDRNMTDLKIILLDHAHIKITMKNVQA